MYVSMYAKCIDTFCWRFTYGPLGHVILSYKWIMHTTREGRTATGHRTKPPSVELGSPLGHWALDTCPLVSLRKL